MKVQILQLPSELIAIKDEWRSLTASIAQNTDFFGGSWDFVWHYVTVIQPREWFVVTFRDETSGRLLAVYPWEFFTLTCGESKLRAVQPLGVGFAPYIDFPVSPAASRSSLQTLLNDVLGRQLNVELLCLWPLHQSSPLYHILLEDLGRSDILKTFRIPSNHHEIETRGLDFERYCGDAPRMTFADARYGERRLRKLGQFAFTLNEAPAEATGIAMQLCQSTKQQFGDAFAYGNKPRWADWVAAMVGESHAQGTAEVATVRLDTQVIASALSFTHQGRRSLYLINYDKDYARYSPGKILLAHHIEATFKERGVYCFGAGTNEYKKHWTTHSADLKVAYVFLKQSARSALEPVLNVELIKTLAKL